MLLYLVVESLTFNGVVGAYDYAHCTKYSAHKSNEKCEADSKYDYTDILHFFITQFVNNTYSEFIGTSPVFIYDLDFQTGQFGNRLGNYFEAVAFAQEMGMHFVGINLQLDEMHHNATKSFTSKLTTLILNPNPKQRADIVAYLKSPQAEYLYNPWPWSYENRLWTRNIDFIATTMTDGISNYLESTYGEGGSFKVSADSFVNGTGLMKPLIPDAVILFRCADILLHGGFVL